MFCIADYHKFKFCSNIQLLWTVAKPAKKETNFVLTEIAKSHFGDFKAKTKRTQFPLAPDWNQKLIK